MSCLFDGVDDSVARISGGATLGSLITVSAWIILNGWGENQSGSVWQQGDAADVARYQLRVLDNKLGVLSQGFGFGSGRVTSNGRWGSDDNVLALNVWRCLAATYDGTLTANNAQLYLDGQPITTNRDLAPAGAQTAEPQNIWIGNNSGLTRSFDGAIGEVAVWKRVLSADEISAVYLLGAAAVLDYWEYLPLDTSGPIQMFGLSGGVYSASGPVMDAGNPPVRPAGRRG